MATDTTLNMALQDVWKKLGLTFANAPVQVPYHGAEAVQTAVRAVIDVTPSGSARPMSANIMIKLLIDNGMPEAMAVKLPSQIRKGAPMHSEWKTAFAEERFLQKLGRTTTMGVSSPSHTTSYKKNPRSTATLNNLGNRGYKVHLPPLFLRALLCASGSVLFQHLSNMMKSQ